MLSVRFRYVALSLASALVSCGGDAPAERSVQSQREIVTTFYPATWLTRRLVGDRLPVVCPLPERMDAASWRPPRDDLVRYQRAVLIVINGAGFESWVEQASLPASRVVDASSGFKDRWITLKEVVHSHGAGGDHSHGGTDGHTWLDPLLMIEQAARIRDALIARLPDERTALEQRFRRLETDLKALHERCAELTPRLAGVQLMCNHAAYNYLARRHGWTITQWALDPGVEVSPEQLAAAPEKAAGSRRRVLLWESEPLASTRTQLEGLGIRSVVFTPCENPTPVELANGADYLSLMNANLDRLDAAVQ